MNVVDSLIVTLGLDATNFKKGQREVNDAWQKARGTQLKNARQIEDGNRRLLEGFNKLKVEALGFLAVLVGAREIKEFVSNITTANAAVKLLAANLGSTPQDIQAFGAAIERMGGSSEAAASTMANLSQAFYDLRYNGSALPKEVYQLFARAGRPVPTQADSLDSFLNKTAGALAELAKHDRTAAFFLGEGMGLSDSMINLMLKYGDATSKYVKSLEGLSATDAQIKNSQKLLDQWSDLSQTAKQIGVNIAGWFSDDFSATLKLLKDTFQLIDDATKPESFASRLFGGMVKGDGDDQESYPKGSPQNPISTEDGKVVSKSNPLPVQVVPNSSGSRSGSGQSWWDWLTGGSGAGTGGGGGSAARHGSSQSAPTSTGSRGGRAGLMQRLKSGQAETSVPASLGDSTIPGFTPAETQKYLDVLGQRESGNKYIGNNAQGYGGRWQMGDSEVSGTGTKRDADWYANKNGAQDRSMVAYTLQHYNQLVAAGVIAPGMSKQTIAGYLAAAHLGGVGGAIALSKGQSRSDANGTPTSSYFKMMQGIGNATPPASDTGAYKTFGDWHKDGKTFGHAVTGATDKGAFVDGQWVPWWAHLPGSPMRSGTFGNAGAGGASAGDVSKDAAQGDNWLKRMWNGTGAAGSVPGPQSSLSTLHAVHPVTTSSVSNQMHLAGGIHVHVAAGTDGKGIADAIHQSLSRYQLAMSGQSGQV